MTDSIAIEMWLGTNWTISGQAMKPDGTPLNLTGGGIEIRIASASGLVTKLTSPGDVLIQPGDQGLYIGSLDDGDSRQSTITPGVYRYEVVSIVASGDGFATTVQNTGKATIHKSLKKSFP